YVPALVVANPGWHGQYDQNPQMAEASRRALLERVVAEKMPICGYHFPFPGAGTIAKDGSGYALPLQKECAADASLNEDKMEVTMKRLAPWLSSLVLAASVASTGALAVDVVTSRDAPDLSSVRAKIKAKDFKGAIAELTPMLETNQHADVYNLMGFSLRKSGDYKQAYTFYRKALDFNPEHKGALEYLGELYVETGQMDKARENVVLLKKLCPSGCEELADLEKAIAGAGGTTAKAN